MKEIVVEYKMAHLELYSMYTIEIYLKSALNITEDQDNTTICKSYTDAWYNILILYSYIQCSKL